MFSVLYKQTFMKPANGEHTNTYTQDDLLTALPSKLFHVIIMCLGVGGVSLQSDCGYWGAL